MAVGKIQSPIISISLCAFANFWRIPKRAPNWVTFGSPKNAGAIEYYGYHTHPQNVRKVSIFLLFLCDSFNNIIRIRKTPLRFPFSYRFLLFPLNSFSFPTTHLRIG